LSNAAYPSAVKTVNHPRRGVFDTKMKAKSIIATRNPYAGMALMQRGCVNRDASVKRRTTRFSKKNMFEQRTCRDPASSEKTPIMINAKAAANATAWAMMRAVFRYFSVVYHL
jgi:hypothetical protein